MSHTPGPWKYQNGLDKYTHIVRGANGRFVVQLSQDTSGQSEADARLIAAATDFLEACWEFVMYYPGGINPDLDRAMMMANRAIQKAERA